MNISTAILTIVMAFLLGTLLGYIYAQSRAHLALERAHEQNEHWKTQAYEANGRLGALEESNRHLQSTIGHEDRAAHLIAPIATRLEDMGARVASLQSAQARQDAALREQLTQAANVNNLLLRETTSLRSALTSVSSRGTWGEVELRRIVEVSGMLPHVDFSSQETLATTTQSSATPSSSSARPDLTIHLPGGAHIAVDAKVPLSSLLKAESIEGCDETSLKAREELLSSHAKALRKHVIDLSKRDYPSEFPGSPRITVLFLPSESLLFQAISHDPSLLEDALALGITPATPSSLLALLRSVAAVWANTRITEEAQEILQLGKNLTSRLQTLSKHLDSLGNALKRSVVSYNKTIASLENRVLVTIRQFDSLDAPTFAAQQLGAEEAQINEITAAELSSVSLPEGATEEN